MITVDADATTGHPPTAATAWDAALYQRQHSFVFELGASLIETLAPRPGEHILDLGCGTGQLAAAIAAAGATVVGLDSSPTMIEQARRNFPHIRFELADATTFDLGTHVDAVFSNAVIHWIRDQEGMAARVATALRPGGRFVAELGGKGNIATIVGALNEVLAIERPDVRPDEFLPWRFPSLGEFAAILERVDLDVRLAMLFERPTPLAGEAGMRDWLEMFAWPYLDAAGERRQSFVHQVAERLRSRLYRDGVWTADYWRLRVVARKA